MKRQVIALIVLTFATFGAAKGQDNKVLTIGNTEITLQSPITVGPKNTKQDSIRIIKESVGKRESQKYWYKRKYVKFYLGLGFATDGSFTGENYAPVASGPSIDFQTGVKFFYRPCRWYAIGTRIQYSYVNYKFRDVSSSNTIIPDVPGDPFAAYYRTDNLGTALLNRFYINRKIYVEAGVYGDWLMSKRFIVKTHMEESDCSLTYRDDELFSSFQAGAELSIGFRVFSVFAKYRFTDLFYRNVIACDPERLNVGVLLSF